MPEIARFYCKTCLGRWKSWEELRSAGQSWAAENPRRVFFSQFHRFKIIIIPTWIISFMVGLFFNLHFYLHLLKTHSVSNETQTVAAAISVTPVARWEFCPAKASGKPWNIWKKRLANWNILSGTPMVVITTRRFNRTNSINQHNDSFKSSCLQCPPKKSGSFPRWSWKIHDFQKQHTGPKGIYTHLNTQGVSPRCPFTNWASAHEP